MTVTLSSLILVTIFSISSTVCAQICNIYCDDRDPNLASTGVRSPVAVTLFGRGITLKISDADNMAYAEINNGDPGDEVWLDRSFDGGVSWEDGSRLGSNSIPTEMRGCRTNMYNIDNPRHSNNLGIGSMRSCAKVNNRPDIACTSWARSTINADTPMDAAATALMQFYDERSLWKTTGWWNSANALTAIIDYTKYTEKTTYSYAIDGTFENNKNAEDGNFTNFYIDDTLWWGLAWVGAYDVTGNEKYLEMAKIDADYSYEYKDGICGGGLWWTVERGYKNAIPNELFIKLAAALHNRVPGDSKYLSQAIEVWNWFRSSGMFNSENLINDGLDSNCKNNGQVTWSYNQGVIIGGLVELFKGTADQNYINEAKSIADAVIRSTSLNPNGVLFDYGCEQGNGDCGNDGPSFKGIFNRNLGELDRVLEGRPYLSWLVAQTDSIYHYSRNSLDQYGVHWKGPFDRADAARQQSALDAFNAAFVSTNIRNSSHKIVKGILSICSPILIFILRTSNTLLV
ncbi:Mannan endo-1,6-alpha-mannosidase DCW1 [Pseudolycoriella hygida]|uniref:Mannan endo-1,6-alpha-mannosidase DCW1 n=1 Tax=Pseudolycoriella hygida TaxID=35572 RepID=A0A9Q0S9H7_9DIPT|nr:Mannan endo-1,6-alpha-mannosidase DCW1 [Pseudolycoriella hygida]